MSSFPLAPTTIIASLYIAYFNRAVESAGLKYWTDVYKLYGSSNENSVTQLVSTWIYAGGQAENALAEPVSDADFIASIYENLLGRGRPALDGVDRAGFNFWLNHLEQGNLTREVFAVEFIRGISAANDPSGAATFALAVKTSLEWARSDASEGLDAEAVREAGTQVLHDALYPPSPEPEPQPEPEPEPEPQPEPDPDNTIMLTMNMVNVQGTPGKDTFIGNIVTPETSFLNSVTRIDGLGSYDKLEITDTATASDGTFSLGTNLTVVNVEELTITTKGAFVSTSGPGSLLGFVGLQSLFLNSEAASTGNFLTSMLMVDAGVNVTANVGGDQFALFGVNQMGVAGTTHITTTGTSGLSVINRGHIDVVDAGVALQVTSVSLDGTWGAATLVTPGLESLILNSLGIDASVSLQASGTQSITITLNSVGVTNPLALDITLSDRLHPSDSITLESGGSSHNQIALTLAADNLLRITGNDDLTFAWQTDVSGGVAKLDASQATGDLTIDLSSGDFDSVNVTLGSGDDTITVDRPGSVDGGDGNNTFVVRAPDVTLIAGAGDDTFDLRDAAVDGGSAVSLITITDLGIGDRIQLAGVTTLATDRVTITGQPHLSLDALLASASIDLAPGMASLITITSDTDWIGEYLLIQDGDNVLDSNDVLVRLENVSPDDGVMLTHQDGYDFISLV